MPSAARIRYIDIAKGFAMFCIIAGHFGIVTANRFVYTFHVPLFFLLSGYFLSTKLPLREFARKKARQLMLPYFIVGLSYIPFTLVIRLALGDSPQVAFDNISTIPLAIIYGTGTPITNPFPVRSIGLLWFLPSLFFASLLVRVALKTKYPIIVLLPFFVFGFVSMNYWTKLPMSLQPACIASLFLYLGHLARKRHMLEKRPPALLIVALVALWIICMYENFSINIVNGSLPGGLISILNSIGASYLIVLASKFIDTHADKLSKALAYCGRNTLPMMCFHGLSDFAFPNYLLFQALSMLPHMTANAIVLALNMGWAVIGIPISGAIPAFRSLFSLPARRDAK